MLDRAMLDRAVEYHAKWKHRRMSPQSRFAAVSSRLILAISSWKSGAAAG